MSDRAARLGVVAIGRNEGERLVRCLRSLQGADVPVVYVDSASTDGSAERASELGAEVLSLDLSRPFTAARARSEGFALLNDAHADLAYVMFIDGDCEVEDGWIAQARSFLEENAGFGVVCGRRRERYPDRTPFNRLIDGEWNTPVGEAQACGGDAVFRVDAYKAVGGFDPRMIAGEEPELCTRLRREGWKIMRLDAPMTIHDAAMDRYPQWWRRAVRSGLGYAQAWRQTRGGTTDALYARELARAIAWAGILPLAAILLALFVNPVLLLIWPIAAAAQWLRLMLRQGAFGATLSITGKYAELLGIARYAVRLLRGNTGGTVHYK